MEYLGKYHKAIQACTRALQIKEPPGNGRSVQWEDPKSLRSC